MGTCGRDPHRSGSGSRRHSSEVFPRADDLSSSEASEFTRALQPILRDRVASADALAAGWLETRLDEEVEILAEACAVAGEPSATDVEWWLRQAVHHAGHGAWFHPTASVRRSVGHACDSFAAKPGETTIEPGDLVHIDFGII